MFPFKGRNLFPVTVEIALLRARSGNYSWNKFSICLIESHSVSPCGARNFPQRTLHCVCVCVFFFLESLLVQIFVGVLFLPFHFLFALKCKSVLLRIELKDREMKGLEDKARASRRGWLNWQMLCA